MGTLYYSAAQYPIRIDDDTLASLKVVLERRLEAGLGMTLSWSEAGFGRSSVWLHPTIPIRLHVDDAVSQTAAQDDVDAMMLEVEQSGGIVLPDGQEAWMGEVERG
ncbi:hypothetical protein ACFQ58_01720 [Agromyces sp. NPDC056523]|uniref:DUF7882 family protein n=1 Tax=Agromyces sp. NPDC056523 TaxID=3345850 RepID=UPI0036701712